jgi:hypothetical protein
MDNIGGVRKKGLTLQSVEIAMREVLEDRFPGIFVVAGPDSENPSIRLQLKEQDDEQDYILVWWDEGDIYPGLIGGKHPRLGDFGYWLLSVIEYGIAAKLKTRIYDEGVGYYRAEEIKRGAEKTFSDHVMRCCMHIEDLGRQKFVNDSIFNQEQDLLLPVKGNTVVLAAIILELVGVIFATVIN